MRLVCYFCGKSVSSEVSPETVVRAVLVCPECIEAGKIQVLEKKPNSSSEQQVGPEIVIHLKGASPRWSKS